MDDVPVFEYPAIPQPVPEGAPHFGPLIGIALFPGRTAKGHKPPLAPHGQAERVHARSVALVDEDGLGLVLVFKCGNLSGDDTVVVVFSHTTQACGCTVPDANR